MTSSPTTRTKTQFRPAIGLFKGVGTVYNQGHRPIIVGGDHAISMGTVAAAAEHLGFQVRCLRREASQ
ncbi:MAG: arginase family protein [Capsulimonadaceae bacterium]